jgi:hypothetical protein
MWVRWQRVTAAMPLYRCCSPLSLHHPGRVPQPPGARRRRQPGPRALVRLSAARGGGGRVRGAQAPPGRVDWRVFAEGGWGGHVFQGRGGPRAHSPAGKNWRCKEVSLVFQGLPGSLVSARSTALSDAVQLQRVISVTARSAASAVASGTRASAWSQLRRASHLPHTSSSSRPQLSARACAMAPPPTSLTSVTSALAFLRQLACLYNICCGKRRSCALPSHPKFGQWYGDRRLPAPALPRPAARRHRRPSPRAAPARPAHTRQRQGRRRRGRHHAG